ncbi:MAG TPA: hypothetical protein DDZ88_27545 [Verrucomicrobiales bacterium]|nr:hypothetical protein [Verrucomicrobiales bacterium]
MTPPRHINLPAAGFGLYAILGGALVLTGWLADVPILTAWGSNGISMMPNAAVCAMCAGAALVALAFGARRLVVGLGIFVALIGAATLFEFATGIDLGIDQLIVAREWGQRGTVEPGRMGPPGSASWTLLGLALALACGGVKARRAAGMGVLLALAVSLLSLVGYAFGADQLYLVPKLTAIALQTATVIFGLSLGLLSALPGLQPMKLLAARTTAGMLARRVLPMVFLLPIGVGALVVWGREAGLFETVFGTALRTLIEIFLLAALLWWALLKVAGNEQALCAAREEAEQAARTKDTFLAQLSHELRTPLTPVLMTAAVLRDDARLPADVRKDLVMIERNIALEARLIDDLLDLTRITSGKLALRTESCDAHSLISHTIEIVRDEAREKQITLTLDLAAQRSQLEADPARLQQVFWNLLRNAVKFTPRGGHIRVESHDGVCERDHRGDGHRVCIAVSDDGIGFSAADGGRLFEPFHQADTTHGAGLGLGLAIARAVVDLHHGHIRAESGGPGRGATFTVELPGEVNRKAQMTAPAAASDGEPELPLRLLLVEDHEATLQVLSRLLKRAGHSVTSAGTVAEAQAAARGQNFDFVISDLGLPDGTGHQLMAHLREAHGLRGIALSGYGMEEDLRRSEEVGFVAHLVKPVDVNELRRILRQVVARGVHATRCSVDGFPRDASR